MVLGRGGGIVRPCSGYSCWLVRGILDGGFLHGINVVDPVSELDR